MSVFWFPWSGGECPYKRGVLVETFWSNGTKLPAAECGGFVWSHDQGHPKLIAYRKVTPLQVHREGLQP